MSDADVQQGITVDLVLQYNLDVGRIYEVYVRMGGMCTESNLLRYLAGAAGLLPLQRDLVAHAVNEQLRTWYPWAPSLRAPYSSATIAVAGGFEVSELDGEALAEHRRAPHGEVPSPEGTEVDRLASLHASGLLDAPVTGPLERLPRMAQAYFGVKGAAFSLITEDELITRSITGTLEGAMPRESTFCNETIRFDRTFVVHDTHRDARFRDSPYVTGPPFIRFYAGHPIHGPGGMRIGALCIIDGSPRGFTTEEQHKLRTLAALVQLEIWTTAV